MLATSLTVLTGRRLLFCSPFAVLVSALYLLVACSSFLPVSLESCWAFWLLGSPLRPLPVWLCVLCSGRCLYLVSALPLMPPLHLREQDLRPLTVLVGAVVERFVCSSTLLVRWGLSCPHFALSALLTALRCWLVLVFTLLTSQAPCRVSHYSTRYCRGRCLAPTSGLAPFSSPESCLQKAASSTPSTGRVKEPRSRQAVDRSSSSCRPTNS